MQAADVPRIAAPPSPSILTHHPTRAWWIAQATVAAVMCGYCFFALVSVILSSTSWRLNLTAALLTVALLAVQWWSYKRPNAVDRSKSGLIVFGIQLLLAYAPLLLFAQAWLGVLGFAAGSALLSLPRGLNAITLLVVMASAGGIQYALDGSLLDVTYTTLGVGIYGVEIYLLNRLAVLAADLHDTRALGARWAVTYERERITTDIQETICRTLSSLNLRGEVCRRLLARRNSGARTELEWMLQSTRTALADVRSTADSYRRLSVADLAEYPVSAGEVATKLEAHTVGRRTAARLVVAVIFGLYASAVIHLLYGPHQLRDLSVSLAFLTGLLVLQLVYFLRPTALEGSSRAWLLLSSQVVLIFAPLAIVGSAWVSLPGFLIASALLILPRRVAAAVVLATTVAVVSIYASFDPSPLTLAFNAVASLVSGLALFGLTRLQTLVVELDQARGELTQLAVTDERLRFAQDLHDMMGLTLSAIALKIELCALLRDRAPERVEAEFDETLTLLRKALAEGRELARGHYHLSLEAEYAFAESAMSVADVEVHILHLTGVLPPEIDSVLAVVLREAVTNVLRHSDARRCDISVSRDGSAVLLHIVNDGAPNDGTGGAGRVATGRIQPSKDSHGATPPAGAGLGNMAHRLAELGGSLRVSLGGKDEHHLHVWLPYVD